MSERKSARWFERIISGKAFSWLFLTSGWIPPVIYLGVTLIATTRWTGANLAWEGFEVLPSWLGWWVPTSAILSAAMGAVEGLAFAYAWGTWRDTGRTNERMILLGLLIATATMFLIALTPYGMNLVENPYAIGDTGVLTRLTEARMRDLLHQVGGLWATGIWSFSLNASTILVGGLVGYSESLRRGMFNAEWERAQKASRRKNR